MLGKYRRAVAFTAPAVLIAAGAVAFSASVFSASVFPASARADSAAGQCQGSRQSPTACTLSAQLTIPVKLSVAVDASPGATGTVSWTVDCSSPSGGSQSTSGNSSGTVPFKAKLGLPKAEGGDCSVSASVSASSGQVSATLNEQAGIKVMISLPTGDTRPGAPLAYFKCLADKNDTLRSGAQVVLAPCADVYADEWYYDGSHLKHRGFCLADPGNGGARTRLLLERCSGSADEAWSITSRGMYSQISLHAHGNGLCIDDPKYSGATNTPMALFYCNGGVNQGWTIQ